MLSVLLKRGVELLEDFAKKGHLSEDVKDYLAKAERFQLEMVAFRGVFDGLVNPEADPVDPQTLTELAEGRIHAEILCGGNILSFDPSSLTPEELHARIIEC
jgi:hypothetical protein